MARTCSKTLYSLDVIHIRCGYDVITKHIGIWTSLSLSEPKHNKINISRETLYANNYICVYGNYNKKTNHVSIYTRLPKLSGIINRKIMHELKLNGCAICGYDECDASLDFHHVNPEDKSNNIQKIISSCDNKKIANELNKCILLCANCHRKIHWGERHLG